MSIPAPSDETIFAGALAQPKAERAAFLEQACDGDPARRARIESLLHAHEAAEAHFMATAPTPTPVVEPAAGERIGRYKLLQKIGEGGCGIVYMAEQQDPVIRRVALKVIKLGMDTKEVIARFEAERQALALMDHPNIARVFDGGATDAGRPFFVMELVRGIPITKYCDEQNLPTAARLELFTQVCHAVQHAHQKGIIHRDLKPSNILVTLHDGKPVPKVIDFGIAKATQGRLTDATLFTAFEQFIGTPAYMSPEQAELSGLDIDTRSDIYSLGVLLYELLTGRPPFDPKTLVAAGLDEIRRIIREVEPPRMSTRLSTLTDLDRATVAKQRGILPAQLSTLLRGDLDWIVMRCLEKDRTRRYETAVSLAHDLQRHLSNEPVMARPTSGLYRLRKTIRRNRAAFAAATAVCVALVLGLVGSLWQASRANREAARANEAEQSAHSEVAIAAAVNEFLNRDVLSQAGALQQSEEGFTPDSNLTVRQALDRAAKRLDEGRFKELPLVEAAVRMSIGNASNDLGAQDASRHLERAYTLRRQNLGEMHPQTLAAAHALAWAYYREDRTPKAIPLAEDVLKRRTVVLGRNHPDTLATMLNLGIFYSAGDGRPEDAIPLFEEVIRQNKATAGDNDRITLRAKIRLAGSYRLVGRMAEALSLSEDAVKRMKASLGPDDPQTIHGMQNLGRIFRDSGRVANSISTLEEALRRAKTMRGETHHEIATCLHELAHAYRLAPGRSAEAIPALEAALKLNRATIGPDHGNTLGALECLAKEYRTENRLAEALALWEENHRLTKAKWGPDDPQTRHTSISLAAAYQTAGRRAEAMSLLDEIEQMKDFPPAMPNIQMLSAINILAQTYRLLGRSENAIRLSELILRRRKDLQGAEHAATITAMNNLAMAYRADGRLEDAISLFEATVRLGKAKRGADHDFTLIEMSNLAAAYRDAGRRNQEISVLEELVKLSETKGQEYPHTLLFMTNLLSAYRAVKKNAEAVPLASKIVQRQKTALGPEHSTTLASISTLAFIYSDLEQWTNAESLRREVLAATRRKNPQDPISVATTEANLAGSLLSQRKFAEAESLFRSVLATREAKIPDNWLTFNARSSVGAALMGQNKLAEARPFLLSGYDGLKAREEKIPANSKFRIRDALARLVELYSAGNESDQAAAWRAKLKAFDATQPTATPPPAPDP